MQRNNRRNRTGPYSNKTSWEKRIESGFWRNIGYFRQEYGTRDRWHYSYLLDAESGWDVLILQRLVFECEASMPESFVYTNNFMKKQLGSGTKGYSLSKYWKMDLIYICEYLAAVVHDLLSVVLYPASAVYSHVLLVLDIFKNR